MRTLTALITTIALVAPSAAIAAVHVGPATGGPHSTYTITTAVTRSSPPSGFGGPVTTYDATITAPKHACGSTRTVFAQETGEAIDAGQTLHFAVKAPRHGWCAGRYRVVVREHTSPAPSVDGASAAPMTVTTVLARTSFRAR